VIALTKIMQKQDSWINKQNHQTNWQFILD